MGWTPLDGIDVPKWRCWVTATEEASVESVSTIGIDPAKHVFQLHGAAADGTALFRRRLRREKRLDFLASQPACVAAMEACASAHYWGREIARLGHEVRLAAPAYVKPFVKRQNNGAAEPPGVFRRPVGLRPARPSARL